jgi:hypothetical protein
MVVALDLEADGLAVSEVEDARVLTGALQDTFPRGGEPLEEERRVLVAAVLGPEEREDRELEVVRLPLQQLDDALELPVGEPQRSMQRDVVNRLFRDRVQAASVSAASDGPVANPGMSARDVSRALSLSHVRRRHVGKALRPHIVETRA